MDTEKANHLTRKGTLGQTIQSIMEDIKPEVAYFIADEGQRTAVFVVNMQNESQLPAIAEPWFLAFDADFSAVPAMLAEDLAKGGPAIEAAGKKYG
jgi:hypothetical protein